jgi:signal transduction histidine kinase
MTLLALTGWFAALAALSSSVVLRARLARHGHLVAQACHEIRGALCAARLGAEMIDAPGLDLDLRRAALALDDLAAAQYGGRAAERCEIVDVGLLSAVVAESWGTRVTLSAPGATFVVAHPERLGQAIGNLLANAIEHGGGSAALCVRRSGGRLRIEVSDDGPGMPGPVADLVRASEGASTARGHGLGIAARIAESYGGRLTTAPAARGARLVLDLPDAEHTAEPELARSPLSWRRHRPLADPEGIA